MNLPINFKIATSILKQIQQIYPNAIMAGGSVRDMLMDKPIKDFDIFIQDPGFVDNTSQTQATNSIFDELKATNVAASRWHESHDVSFWIARIPSLKSYSHTIKFSGGSKPNNNKVTRCLQFYNRELSVDIIFTTNIPTEHVNRHFDVGLCKAYFNGSKMVFSSDFMRDRTNQTLTILGEEMDKAEIEDCLAGHVARLRAKYPSFRVVYAPHLQHLVG